MLIGHIERTDNECIVGTNHRGGNPTGDYHAANTGTDHRRADLVHRAADHRQRGSSGRVPRRR